MLRARERGAVSDFLVDLAGPAAGTRMADRLNSLEARGRPGDAAVQLCLRRGCWCPRAVGFLFLFGWVVLGYNDFVGGLWEDFLA